MMGAKRDEMTGVSEVYKAMKRLLGKKGHYRHCLHLEASLSLCNFHQSLILVLILVLICVVLVLAILILRRHRNRER